MHIKMANADHLLMQFWEKKKIICRNNIGHSTDIFKFVKFINVYILFGFILLSTNVKIALSADN